MVQYTEKFKKNIVTDMRKRGFSYSEIQNSVSVPKSTLSYWLKGVNLSDFQLDRLQKKRDRIARDNAQRRAVTRLRELEEIKIESSRAIGTISKRELWLMGLMLCKPSKKVVEFMSKDPYLVCFFLKWLKDIGKINSNEISLEIFIKKDYIQKAVSYWHKITDFSESDFKTAYYLKNGLSTSAPYGYLKVRVRASSMMANQITGWVEGIKDNL